MEKKEITATDISDWVKRGVRGYAKYIDDSWSAARVLVGTVSQESGSPDNAADAALYRMAYAVAYGGLLASEYVSWREVIPKAECSDGELESRMKERIDTLFALSMQQVEVRHGQVVAVDLLKYSLIGYHADVIGKMVAEGISPTADDTSCYDIFKERTGKRVDLLSLTFLPYLNQMVGKE